MVTLAWYIWADSYGKAMLVLKNAAILHHYALNTTVWRLTQLLTIKSSPSAVAHTWSTVLW